MSLPRLYGHEGVRRALANAVHRGTLSQSLLLHGPRGTGKERLGLWLGQLLLCERPGNEPCGSCVACRRAERLEHPDLHWFFPLPRPDSTSPSQLRSRLEELRAAELHLRRQDPTYRPSHDRPPAHFLAAMQTLQEIAAVRPSVGARKVFVVGDAEAMVPQESSPEAANAFLKLLEEPPEYATLILTTSAPDALLPTIRSRVLPLRVLPLSAGEVESFLNEYAGAPADRVRQAAARSGGAIGRALAVLAAGDGRLDTEETALNLLRAVLDPGPVARLALAHREAPSGARGAFTAVLDALVQQMRHLLAAISDSGAPVHSPALASLVRSVHEAGSVSPRGLLAAIERVLRARELALGNVNPQLILATLLREVQHDLHHVRP